MGILEQITAGDSASWLDNPTTDNLGNTIAPPSWALKYAIKQGSVSVTLTAVQSGSQWKTTISKAQSATFAAGDAYWQAYAEKGTDRITLSRGVVKILPSIADSLSSYDGRSQIKQDLDAVQAAIRARLSGSEAVEYTIAGRSLRKTPMADLIMLERKLKSDYAQEIRHEAIKNGMPNPSRAFVRFI